MSNLISVIVPVYKVESYLDRCIESIVSQTYTDLEIILVDDGSPDRCPEICDAWAVKDNRIQVIHQKNGGLSDARNCGTEAASGEYILYVDSDDVINCEMVSHLMMLICEFDADLVECGYIPFDKEIQWSNDCSVSKYHFQGKERFDELLNNRHFGPPAWNKLFRSDIAKSVKFEYGKIHEDILWSYRILKKCERVAFTTERLYGYRKRPDSIMSSMFSEKRFDELEALKIRSEEVKRDFPEDYPLAEQAYAGMCMYTYQLISRTNADRDGYMREAVYRRFCDSDLQAVFSSLRIKYVLWYKLFADFPSFTSFIRNKFRIGL